MYDNDYLLCIQWGLFYININNIERINLSSTQFFEKHSKPKFSLQLIYDNTASFISLINVTLSESLYLIKKRFQKRRQLKTPFPAVIVGSCQTKGTERDGHHLPINVNAVTSLKQIETRHSLKRKLRKDLTKTTLCISSVALM